MPRELPETPSLEHLRKEAKALVRRHAAHDPGAAALLGEYHPAWEGRAPEEILASPLQLCEAQLALARQYGFPSWAQLKAHVESIAGAGLGMMVPLDTSRIADPEYRGQLAAQKGLPPVGATAVSRYGMHYTVVEHVFGMTLASIARAGDGEVVPVMEELLPVLSFSGMSQRLTDFYFETDRCTSKDLVFFDSVPELHPGSAVPGLHQVLTTQDPTCLTFHLDAANLHETILAHELGHVWVEMVEGCEDFRLPRFLADTPKATQFHLIQSFVLDFRVNAVLLRKGFDLTVVDAQYWDAIVRIADHCARGDRPRTERTAAALINTVAAVMLDHDRWPESAVRCLDACLDRIRSGLPEVYRAARAFVASVEKHGVADRESIRRVIDECALVSFGLTGDDFDAERDLEEIPHREWMRDKHPGFLPGLPVPTKLRVWRAMAKQGIGPRVEYRMVPLSRGILEITVRDTSGGQPAPPPFSLCVPVALPEAHPLRRPVPLGQRPGLPAVAPLQPGLPVAAWPLGLPTAAPFHSGLPVPAWPPGVVSGPSQPGLRLAVPVQPPVVPLDPGRPGPRVPGSAWPSEVGFGPSRPAPGRPARVQPPQVRFGPTPAGQLGMVMPQPAAAPVPWDPLGTLRDSGIHGGGRRYMPGVGRWLSRVGFEKQPDEHPYAYAYNSPVRYVDPGGDTPTEKSQGALPGGRAQGAESVGMPGTRTGDFPGGRDPFGAGGWLGNRQPLQRSPHKVSEPGLIEGLIPVWGSGKAAVHHFQRGHWVQGTMYAGLAVTDVFILEAAVVTGGKLLLKGVAVPIMEAAGRRTATQAVAEASAASTRRILVHLTTGGTEQAIRASGEVGGKWGIFVLEEGRMPANYWARKLLTGARGRLTGQVEIGGEAAEVFVRPPLYGPFSLVRRAKGVLSSPLGSVERGGATELLTEFRAGRIFKHGQFRPATTGEVAAQVLHQGWVDYAPDFAVFSLGKLTLLAVDYSEDPELARFASTKTGLPTVWWTPVLDWPPDDPRQ